MNEQSGAKLTKDTVKIYKEQGLTKNDLAEDIGVSPDTITVYENGLKPVSPNVQKLMETLVNADKANQKEQ
ncbi:MAG: helix-turn-helix transcriptional regulator [Akkermansia sp.]|nr:helix-turn-helix transcriptional regulator [Akkermansia sp.]